MKTYVTRRFSADAVEYTGDNTDEVISFHEDVRVNGNGEPEAWLSDHRMVIRPGWWVYKEDTVLGVCSDRAFRQFFREPSASSP